MKTADDHAQEFEERPLWKSGKWLVGGIVVVLVVIAAIFLIRVAVSGVAGKGQAHIDKNSADNFESAQRVFHQEFNDYQQIIGAHGTLATAVAQKKGWEKNNPAPSDPIALTTWSQTDQNYQTPIDGLSQNCHNIVSDYNTNAQSYLTKDFRDSGLPATLDDAACNPQP